MPPQPVSSKRRDAKIDLDPIALRRHAELAPRISDVIAYWARIESVLGTILGRMLGTHARPSIAMYEAIRSTQTQMDVLEAAAKVALAPENFEVFSPLMVVVKRAGNKRNKVAHWLWGDSDAFPDDLILVDPSAVREQDKNVSDAIAAIERGDEMPHFPKLDLSLAFVWEEGHFFDLIEELNDVYHLTLRFAGLVSHGGMIAMPGDAGLRSQLLSAPRIQEVLRRKGG